MLFNSAEEDRLDGTGSLDYTDGDLTATSSLHDQSGPGDSRTSGRRKGEPGDDNLPPWVSSFGFILKLKARFETKTSKSS